MPALLEWRRGGKVRSIDCVYNERKCCWWHAIHINMLDPYKKPRPRLPEKVDRPTRRMDRRNRAAGLCGTLSSRSRWSAAIYIRNVLDRVAENWKTWADRASAEGCRRWWRLRLIYRPINDQEPIRLVRWIQPRQARGPFLLLYLSLRALTWHHNLRQLTKNGGCFNQKISTDFRWRHVRLIHPFISSPSPTPTPTDSSFSSRSIDRISIPNVRN